MPQDSARSEIGAERVPVDGMPPAAVVELPALIAGHLTIDGAAPEGGEFTLRAEDGRVWAARLARDGGFSVAEVPLAKLTLSFQLQPFEQRPLLLPSVDFVPRSGATEALNLDWKTSQVNVRVIDDGLPGSHARVEIEGPHLRSSFETNEKGIAKVSLVGAGHFSLRAVVPGGRSGQTTVEIGEDEELTSVVIATESR